MAKGDTDIDALTEAELLALPESLIPAGSLTTYWALHAAAIQKDNADELARERTGASRSRRMIGGADTEQEAEDRRRAEAERDLRRREDAMLALISEQEREIEEQRQEIQGRAIRMADGRRVFVDGDDYRDADGRKLEGKDRDEAAGKRQENSATWQEREENERQLREAERRRREIEENRNNPAPERENNLDVYEQEFRADKAAATKALETGTTDYSAGYADYLDSPPGSGEGAGLSARTDQPTPAPQGRGPGPKV
jgi:hypothetical protein